MYELAVMREQALRNKEAAFFSDPGVVIDTMLNAYLIDENEPVNLNHQVVTTLRAKPYWTGLPPKEQGYGDVPLDELMEYCGNDVHHTYRLMEHQHKIMSPELQRIQREVWAPLCSLLLTMRERGICCDKKKMEKILSGLVRKAKAQDKKVEANFPGLNVRSNKQMAELLYDKLKVRPVRKTKGKGRSADEKSIKAFRSSSHASTRTCTPVYSRGKNTERTDFSTLTGIAGRSLRGDYPHPTPTC
jgi:DNA polymerase I-like protein with 3'-5' exonuclease and polymerase domains